MARLKQEYRGQGQARVAARAEGAKKAKQAAMTPEEIQAQQSRVEKRNTKATEEKNLSIWAEADALRQKNLQAEGERLLRAHQEKVNKDPNTMGGGTATVPLPGKPQIRYGSEGYVPVRKINGKVYRADEMVLKGRTIVHTPSGKGIPSRIIPPSDGESEGPETRIGTRVTPLTSKISGKPARFTSPLINAKTNKTYPPVDFSSDLMKPVPLSRNTTAEGMAHEHRLKLVKESVGAAPGTPRHDGSAVGDPIPSVAELTRMYAEKGHPLESPHPGTQPAGMVTSARIAEMNHAEAAATGGDAPSAISMLRHQAKHIVASRNLAATQKAASAEFEPKIPENPTNTTVQYNAMKAKLPAPKIDTKTVAVGYMTPAAAEARKAAGKTAPVYSKRKGKIVTEGKGVGAVPKTKYKTITGGRTVLNK